MALRQKKKGLFMTILILVLFLLILGELMTFALLNVNYNSIAQSSALSSTSLNYARAISSGASIFASLSLSSALNTLASYELNASMRKSNLIANTSQYLTYLVVNGTLPNIAANSIPANYLSKSMANLTLSAYNASLSTLFNLGAQSIIVNQTKPTVFQSSPYTLSMKYLQNVLINSSSGKFRYQIPVNVTISLNNTPDLFYYQQGITRNVRFSQLSNLTTLIGGINATNGNFLASAYGPIYQVPTGAGGLTCASLSAMVSANVPAFSFAPYNQMLILATSNAIGITTGASGTQCANQYGGLITYSINSVTMPPSMPWLAYPSATGLLGNLKNGQQVLMLGNTLSTYNIQNLITAASSGYYFASPFTTSYLDKAQSSMLKQNTNGVFTFSNFNSQGATFNGPLTNSYINVPSNGLLIPSNSLAISFWIYSANTITSSDLIQKGMGSATRQYYIRAPTSGCCVSGHNLLFYFGNGARQYLLWTSPSALTLNSFAWHHLVFAVNDTSQIGYGYIDGALKSTNTPTALVLGPSSSGLTIGGYSIDGYSNATMADVQIYNQSLSGGQVEQLYQEGISGLPVNNNALVGWWPLNGNSNDYSGYNFNGVAANVIYTLPTNYVRDSILSITTPTALSSFPGLLNCNNNSQCSNTLLPHAYLGYMPLGMQQNFLQVASFNGLNQCCSLNSYINVGNIGVSGDWTISFWGYVNTVSPSLQYPIGFASSPISGIFMAITPSEDWGLYDGANVLYGTPIQTNTWYGITVTKAGNTYTLYANGKSVNSLAMAGLSLSNLNIGRRDDGVPLSGSMSNVQIYSSALNANQVAQLYNGGIYGLPLTNNVLAGWWPLNGNANDYSGYSNNGIPSNVIFPYFSGTYNAPGLSTVSAFANEWQALGIPRSGG